MTDHYLGRLDIDKERDEITNVLARVDDAKVRPFLQITRAAEYGKAYIQWCNSESWLDRLLKPLVVWRMEQWY